MSDKRATWDDQQIREEFSDGAYGAPSSNQMMRESYDYADSRVVSLDDVISTAIKMRDEILAEADGVMAENVQRAHETMVSILDKKNARIAALENELRTVRAQAGVWEPVDYLVNDQLAEIQADRLAVTIGYDDTAMATFAWPEEGQYAIMRRVEAPAERDT